MKTTLSYLVFALVASTSSLAFGLAVEDPCATVDCPSGEVCEVLDREVCSCTAQPGSDGEDPNGDAAPCECEPQTGEGQAVCVPAPPTECDSDSDCGSDDVCVTYTFGSCGGSDGAAPIEPECPPNDEECDQSDPIPEPEPEPCNQEVESICVPKYAAPCEAAADCGAGFTCETPEICTCTAGAPIACDAEDPEQCENDRPVDDCSCAPSEGDAYCRLIEVECTDDSDCQNGMSCLATNTVGRAEIPCAEDDSDCGASPRPQPVSYCVPDGYRDWADNGGSGSVDGKKVESAKRNSFFNPTGNNGSGDKSSAGGCSVNQSPNGFGAAAILLFGMLFGFRRNRKK